jgi:hypothetical protein
VVLWLLQNQCYCPRGTTKQISFRPSSNYTILQWRVLAFHEIVDRPIYEEEKYLSAPVLVLVAPNCCRLGPSHYEDEYANICNAIGFAIQSEV